MVEDAADAPARQMWLAQREEARKVGISRKPARRSLPGSKASVGQRRKSNASIGRRQVRRIHVSGIRGADARLRDNIAARQDRNTASEIWLHLPVGKADGVPSCRDDAKSDAGLIEVDVTVTRRPFDLPRRRKPSPSLSSNVGWSRQG